MPSLQPRMSPKPWISFTLGCGRGDAQPEPGPARGSAYANFLLCGPCSCGVPAWLGHQILDKPQSGMPGVLTRAQLPTLLSTLAPMLSPLSFSHHLPLVVSKQIVSLVFTSGKSCYSIRGVAFKMLNSGTMPYFCLAACIIWRRKVSTPGGQTF